MEVHESSVSSQDGGASANEAHLGLPPAAPARAAGSRAGSLLPGASMDLTLLELASSASADLRYRRAESLLPCGLTADEVGVTE